MGKSVRPKQWSSLTYFLFFSYLILIICTFLNYGITYDEDWHSTYGEHIVQWYASGFHDTKALTYWTLPLQGDFFGVVVRLASRISPIGVFETSHLINAILGLLGVFGAHKLGKLLGGPSAGFLSALFLVVTPRFYGHAFNNPVDIPLATLSIFAIYYLIRSLHYLPNVPRGLILTLGVMMGLALAVRVGAIILVGYICLTFCLWFLGRYLFRAKGTTQTIGFRSTLFKLAGTFLIICLIAYLVMLIWWPAAQISPFFQPVKAFWYATHFGYSIDVFFEGKVLPNTDLPWYYVSKWFLITLPEFYFVALISGIVVGIVSIIKQRKALIYNRFGQTIPILILLICVILPVGYTVLTSPVEYDGMRHYLFLLPPLAIIAAISVTKLVERIRSRLVLMVVMIVILASVILTVVDMVELHPHQYIFFNRIFGKGVAKASQSFETDYWGNSYKEGVEWIVNNYQSHNNDRKIKVASCLYPLSASYFLPEDRFEYVGSYDYGHQISNEEVDLFIATTRWNCHKNLTGTVLHTVTRKGIPLLYIIKVSHDLSMKSDEG